MAKGQAERLMVLLEEVLEAGGTRWADLTRIGVGIGPGNFTGIRIAVLGRAGLGPWPWYPGHRRIDAGGDGP